MTLLKFILLLVFQGFVFTWICPFLHGPFLGLAMLALRKTKDEKIRGWTWLVLALAFAGTAYVLWGWAAYVAWLAHSWSVTPEVTQHWLYYVIGFFGCVSPLSAMAAGERNTGSSVHILLTSVAFVVFCIWPVTAIGMYGWLPALFGK
jgi:hypothetical protein